LPVIETACVGVTQTCYFNGRYVISIHGTAYRCTYNQWGSAFLQKWYLTVLFMDVPGVYMSQLTQVQPHRF